MTVWLRIVPLQAVCAPFVKGAGKAADFEALPTVSLSSATTAPRIYTLPVSVVSRHHVATPATDRAMLFLAPS